MQRITLLILCLLAPGSAWAAGATFSLVCDNQTVVCTNGTYEIPTIRGGSASGGNLTLSSTSHATKGKILFGTAGTFDEASKFLGVGTTTAPGGGRTAAIVAHATGGTGSFRIEVDASQYAGYEFFKDGLQAATLFLDNAAAGGVFSIWTNSSSRLALGANSSEYLSIINGGNIGIRNTNPGAALALSTGASTTIGQIFKGAAAQAADLTRWQDSSDNVLGGVNSTGLRYSTAQAVTCADSGDANPGALTIQPTSNVVTITNSDANGCNITMSEIGAVAGSDVRLVVISNAGGTVNFADSAGVSELAGAYNAIITQTLSLLYVNSAWHETGRSAN